MKRSIATSAVIHVLVLVGAMLTLSAPAPLETPESSAMDVDIVPADQIQQGEKHAPVTDHASPKQTKKQTQVANAQNAGENDVDLKNPAVPTQRPVDENAVLAPKKVDAPVPQNDPRPNEVKTIEQQDTEAAPKEVAAIPQQKPDVTPTPPQKVEPTPPPQKVDPTPVKTETPPAPTPTPQKTESKPTPPPETDQPTEQAAQPTPDNVPVPDIKPQPPAPPKTADAKPEVKPDPKPVVKPEVKVADAKPTTKPTDKTTTQSTSKNSSADNGQKDSDKKRETPKGSTGLDDGLADEISKVLNNTSSGGGAKRSSNSASAGAQTNVASTGGMKSLSSGKLSQSQQDGLRDLIAKNWNVLPGLEGAADVKIRVHFKLDKSGKIIGEPEVSASGGPASTQSALAFAAQMAVMRSQSDFLKILPPDKYDTWQEVVVNFDASDLGL